MLAKQSAEIVRMGDEIRTLNTAVERLRNEIALARTDGDLSNDNAVSPTYEEIAERAQRGGV